jgi:hypothetical protein
MGGGGLEGGKRRREKARVYRPIKFEAKTFLNVIRYSWTARGDQA